MLGIRDDPVVTSLSVLAIGYIERVVDQRDLTAVDDMVREVVEIDLLTYVPLATGG